MSWPGRPGSNHLADLGWRKADISLAIACIAYTSQRARSTKARPVQAQTQLRSSSRETDSGEDIKMSWMGATLSRAGSVLTPG